MTSTLGDLLVELSKDPEFQAEYRHQKPYYDALPKDIKLRKMNQKTVVRKRFELAQTIPLLGQVKADENISAWVNGGYLSSFSTAPIDLEPGDMCTVILGNGKIIKVEREGKTIWRLDEP